MFLDMYKHLLPTGRAWLITIDKTLRRFFIGLSGTTEDAVSFSDDIYSDINPITTRNLSDYEIQFGISNTGIDEDQRRSRLDAAWKATGGQSPRYIQDTLQANGFNVYIHEWWEPGTEPEIGSHACAVARNPMSVLRRSSDDSVVYFGEAGQSFAEAGQTEMDAGNTVSLPGFLFVNNIIQTIPRRFVQCGEPLAVCGDPSALCGNFVDFVDVKRTYVIPEDPEKWAYFLYFGGESFGECAIVDKSRREEFENLCRKISPGHMWLGMLINYE